MELKHTYDINHLNDIIKKNEINFESQINQIKEKYDILIKKYDESNISNNEL